MGRSEETTIKVERSEDYLLVIDSKYLPAVFRKVLIFEFTQKDVTSDIDLRVIMESPANLDIFLLVKAPMGVTGVSSSMDMRALLLNKGAKIRFIPSLEIDEMDVSVDHKSSIGSLTDEWVDYLSSRGLSDENIKNVLKKAFLKI